MTEFEKKVLDIVSEHPGLKARDIAEKLGCEKKEVNSTLYGPLKHQCFQDSAYRWYLKVQHISPSLSNQNLAPDKKLSDICKYYLNCLSIEESSGVSAFLTSKFSLNYCELTDISIDSSNDNVANLARKVSNDRNLVSYMGYPCLIEKIYSAKTKQHYFKIAPVFLFPVEISSGTITISHIPHINMEVIKQYSSRDANAQVYDLVELENELGLNALDADVELDELVSRLQSIRDWQWKDDLDPSAINPLPSVSSLEEEGIYNRAIFIVTERSPYTVGLESELSELAKLNEEAYRDTALYDWIHYRNMTVPNTFSEDSPLLEVLPMNSEQEQAIKHSLNNKLTIVTGPPGTGKSQVVTNLLVNAAWNGKSVLLTSKNNKAVDVVETRVNSLGRRPIMLRIGGNQYAYHLAELISDLLSSSSDETDQQEYQYYNKLYQRKLSDYNSLKHKKSEVVNLRNNADHMEQCVCALRDKWSKWFKIITNDDVEGFKIAFNQYSAAYDTWYQSKKSLFGKLFWFIIGKKKTVEFNVALSTFSEYLQKYEQPIKCQDVTNLTPTLHAEICEQGKLTLYILQKINSYRESLDLLLTAPHLEDIDRRLISIKSELADIAETLWNKWLITRPVQMDANCRREMNEYVSAMRLIGDVSLSEHPDINRKFNNLQRKMTNYLPCWAVTSLSAKGRIPFQAGMFDLVVIDEASQCDIASVLPMLYRAKHAVIIGDPKQLSHISTISKKQDLSLLQKYDIDMRWAYSANSLYEMASSLSEPNQIIRLRDHHRSFGDIIEFSNKEFYDGKLRIATNYDKLNCPKDLNAGIRWINIIGETVRPSSGGAYNDAETENIVKELKRLTVDNNYNGTIGVVTPFRAQAERIHKAILADTELKNALAKNDFLVDTVHKFQGDERDLIFFSPVISHGTEQGALGFLKNTGNLFNVAVTRARAVLIVVGDLNYCAECGVPYMEHFVSHVNSINTKDSRIRCKLRNYPSDRSYPKVSNPEQVSDWERHFYSALFDAGIKTLPQYPVDKYTLDLAIIDGSRMLDIEVDGEMYHKDWNGELSYRDQLRNQRLFELGWDVKRFWVYQIRDNLDSCVKEISAWYNE